MGNQKVFTSQKIRILQSGEEIEVQALISIHGAKYVFEDQALPEMLRSTLGRVIDLEYKGIPAQGKLLREQTTGGLMYNLKFFSPSQALLKKIAADIEESGIPTPWRRALPRISTANSHLPMPTLLALYYKEMTFFLTVRNFTLGGILCEYSGSELQWLPIGVRLNFDIITNAGDKISSLSGVLCHISEERIDEQKGNFNLFLGIRFLPMSSQSEAMYKKIIRDHCEGLKE